MPETFARAVHEETDGNPFFVEEVLGHLVDRGTLHRTADGWEVPAALDDLGAPDGVRDLVRRRASSLSAEAQRLLGVAALMGREFDLDVVADVADVKVDEVLDAFEQAVAVGLIAEIPDAAGRYRFGHALSRRALEESSERGPARPPAPTDRRSPRTPPARTISRCLHITSSKR